MAHKVMNEIDGQLLNSDFIPKIISLAEDKVPNVRFNVAKFVSNSKDLISEENRSAFLEALQKQTSDEDQDVKYYAQRAIEDLDR